ncbi:unnamed protein product [Schistosoma bovis]|nr:unnamed protein product [Schistosoma bovis]CAH8601100.1 unnamed protein product [Schistosoma bovis]
MNANLLHLLLAIVVTASITDIHAYRKGHFDRPADESDTNTGINDLHDEYNEGNRESSEINYNDPRDTMDISSEYDIEQLCSLTDSLVQYYEGNCMRNTSQFVNEDDVKSAYDGTSFDNHPGENEVIENHDNVPDGTVDISTAIGNALGFQLSDKYGDRRFKNRN